MEIIDNNRDIFRYLSPDSNDLIMGMSNGDRVGIMLSLRNYYLELRQNLGLTSDITFAPEIEFENAKRDIIENYLRDNFPYRSWRVVDDRSLYHGGEINCPVFRDNEKTWSDLSKVCSVVSLNAEVLENTSTHIHIGMHILGNNAKYWRNFVKIWMTYENVITRFLYGEYVAPRERFAYFAEPISKILINDFEMIEKYGEYSTALAILTKLNKDDAKKRSVNFRHIGKTELYNYSRETDKNTIEFRGGNGTFDAIVIQNYINLLVKVLLYAKSDNFDEDMINRRLGIIKEKEIPSNLYKYSQIHTEQAFEFADLIFDNNLDKVYFLRQYFKDGVVSTKPLTKSKRFTM